MTLGTTPPFCCVLDHAVPVDAEPVVPSLADFPLEQSRPVHAPEE